LLVLRFAGKEEGTNTQASPSSIINSTETKDGGNIEMGKKKKKSKGSFLLRPFLSTWSILHLPSSTSSTTHPPTHPTTLLNSSLPSTPQH
jgi:hypothetical protein